MTPFLDKEREDFLNHPALKFANDAIVLQATRMGTQGYTGDENLLDWLKAHDERVLAHVRQIVSTHLEYAPLKIVRGGFAPDMGKYANTETNRRLLEILSSLTLPTAQEEKV